MGLNLIRPELLVTGGGLEFPAGRVATRGFATAATNAPGSVTYPEGTP